MGGTVLDVESDSDLQQQTCNIRPATGRSVRVGTAIPDCPFHVDRAPRETCVLQMRQAGNTKVTLGAAFYAAWPGSFYEWRCFEGGFVKEC